MSQSTVEIIDPKHPHFGETVTVDAWYGGIWIFGKTAGNAPVSVHKSQVKVLQLRDPDIWLEVVGNISIRVYTELSKELAALPTCFVAGGWTGERGQLSLKFDDSASAHLEQTQEIAGR